MLTWNSFIDMLGVQKTDTRVVRLSQELNELPDIDESVLGDRTYYSFFRAGILLLIEDEQVDQISFYIEADEGFEKYKGELPFSAGHTESEIVGILGSPSSSGGGKTDTLLGYIDRWVKYDNDKYSLHLQFSQNNILRRATLAR